MNVQALLILPDDDSPSARASVRIEPGRRSTIGRSRGCDILLNSPGVSGTHATVELKDGGLYVEDKGSSNGTSVLRDDGEQALEPGVPTEVGASDAILVPGYRLVPCELLGDGVAISAHAMLDVETRDVGGGPAPSTAAEDSDRALAALAEALRHDGTSAQLWPSLLAALVRLASARRGFLVSCEDDRWLLRASTGDGCLAKGFLEQTRSRTRSWSLSPASLPAGDDATPSMRAYGPDTRLVGVPFLDRTGAAIAVGYLEQAADGPPTASGLLDAFAQAAGPVLGLADALDRETRRRQALESRAGAESETADGAESASGVALIGNSDRFREAVETVEHAAGSRVNLLIRGPSGSGKEQLAQLAHVRSARSNGPFVVLNCAALPEALVESELFGADRGSYTGADRNRPGAFTQAHGGTLFLDEIGDLPLAAQSKILRVIETGEVVRVGGSRQQVDVRLVTATHRDLEAMVADGTFREDLYYRLRVVEVVLPRLAERGDDVLPLAEHFLSRIRQRDGGTVQGISVRAGNCLSRYEWPGNVRELRNVIERAVALDRDGVLDVDDLPAEIRDTPDESPGTGGGVETLFGLKWTDAKHRFEEAYFRKALERHAGAVQETAEATGLDRRTLSTKISRHGLRKSSD